MTGAGNLDTRLVFDERGAPSGADFGQSAGAFVEQFTVWASILYQRGSEPVVNARLEGRLPAIVRVRWSSRTVRITGGWRARLLYGDVTFNIRSVTPVGRQKWLDLQCEAGGASG